MRFLPVASLLALTPLACSSVDERNLQERQVDNAGSAGTGALAGASGAGALGGAAGTAPMAGAAGTSGTSGATANAGAGGSTSAGGSSGATSAGGSSGTTSAGAGAGGASAGAAGGGEAGSAAVGGTAGGAPQAGASGTSGAGAGSSGAAGSGSGSCPSNVTFCTGFEEAGIPAGAAYQPTYQAAQWADFIALDTTVVNSGSQSLQIKPTGSSGYSYRMLSVPAPATSYWVRLYVRSDVDLGQAEHNAFFGASTGNGDQNMGSLMEVAEQYCQVVMNLRDDVVLSIGGTAACGSGGKLLAKDTWHCMEAFFDGPNGAVQVYANDMPIIDKTAWTTLEYQSFVFGFISFHGPSRTMWYDDVAISAERIGCP
jgi:hypothetical protein